MLVEHCWCLPQLAGCWSPLPEMFFAGNRFAVVFTLLFIIACFNSCSNQSFQLLFGLGHYFCLSSEWGHHFHHCTGMCLIVCLCVCVCVVKHWWWSPLHSSQKLKIERMIWESSRRPQINVIAAYINNLKNSTQTHKSSVSHVITMRKIKIVCISILHEMYSVTFQMASRSE